MITKYTKCAECGLNEFEKENPNPKKFAEFIEFGGPDKCNECAKEDEFEREI